MDTSILIDKDVESNQPVQHNSSVLDLVFAMDCTGSMGAYIDSATKNIRLIVEEIVTNEQSDIRLALIEYRDHPPQDMTFVTRVHNFTDTVEEMKQWLEQCQAQGGGDIPEAVADALHDVLTLSWRSEATKICILISDAPPHGLISAGDSFPNGCPAGLDTIKIVRQMAENNITLYTVGVEPPIIPYRDFFMSLAYITGGQYVPLVNANFLAQVIIGGVREEISLDHLMKRARHDIAHEIQLGEEDGVDERETAKRINRIFSSQNIRVKQMRNTHGATSKTVEECYSKCVDMDEMKSKYKISTRNSRQKMGEMNYTLKEDTMTFEQAKRLIQKVKNQKLVTSKSDEATIEKQLRKNNRDKSKQENNNSKRHQRRTKGNASDILINTKGTQDRNDEEEIFVHNDVMMETNHLLDQDITEKQSEIVRKRRRKDITMPKPKINKRSNKIPDSLDVPVEEVFEPVLITNTTNDNTTMQPILHTEQVHLSVQSNYNIFYLIVFFVLIAIISACFYLFK